MRIQAYSYSSHFRFWWQKFRQQCNVLSCLIPSSSTRVGDHELLHQRSPAITVHSANELPVHSLISSIHFLLCRPLVRLPLILPSRMCVQRFWALTTWPKYCSFRFLKIATSCRSVAISSKTKQCNMMYIWICRLDPFIWIFDILCDVYVYIYIYIYIYPLHNIFLS